MVIYTNTVIDDVITAPLFHFQKGASCRAKNCIEPSWCLNYGGAYALQLVRENGCGLAHFHSLASCTVEDDSWTAFFDCSYGSDNCSNVRRKSKMHAWTSQTTIFISPSCVNNAYFVFFHYAVNLTHNSTLIFYSYIHCYKLYRIFSPVWLHVSL